MTAIALTALKFCLPFVAGALAHALHRAHVKERELIEKRIHNEALKLTLLHLDEVIASVGSELFRDIVKASSDGGISDEARASLFATYLAKARAFLGNHRENELGRLLGLVEDAVLGFIASKLEAKLHELDRREAVPAVVLPDTGIRLAPPSLS